MGFWNPARGSTKRRRESGFEATDGDGVREMSMIGFERVTPLIQGLGFFDCCRRNGEDSENEATEKEEEGIRVLGEL